MLDRKAVLAVEDLKTEVVQVPEWGGEVRIRTLTGEERDLWEERRYDVDDKGKIILNRRNFRASFVAALVVDEEGKQIFRSGDIGMLSKKSAVALDRICDAGRKLNGMSEEEIEELGGNSAGGRSEDSGSS